MKLVKPKTYLLGYTNIDQAQLYQYLEDTEQDEFKEFFREASNEGLSTGEILCSFYGKLCYKSLVLGKNLNVSKIRDVENNLKGCFDTKHGSIFEHFQLNFVTTNCSRVFTHELVRHRVGTAFSQTSGRYVSIENLDLVIDPILDPVLDEINELGLIVEDRLRKIRKKLIEDAEIKDFATKKKITSAIRRLAPNGQSNEIGWSCNIRSLRHMIEMRTSRHAEWEIRLIFNQVADIIQQKFPLMLYGCTIECVDGMNEYTGLKV